jgi:hypothetical protein
MVEETYTCSLFKNMMQNEMLSVLQIYTSAMFRECSYFPTKGCSKPEAYCLLPLGGPKYKEKKTREARLGLESMFRIIDPSPLPIPDRQFKMLPG